MDALRRAGLFIIGLSAGQSGGFVVLTGLYSESVDPGLVLGWLWIGSMVAERAARVVGVPLPFMEPLPVMLGLARSIVAVDVPPFEAKGKRPVEKAEGSGPTQAVIGKYCQRFR
jgi:hypothetical protein